MIFRLVTLLAIFFHIASVFAENNYRMTGVARIYSRSSSARPNLELPGNPAFSSVLSLRRDTDASARDRYWLVGAAKAESSAEFHQLSLPSNPIFSGNLSLSGGIFIYDYIGHECRISVKESRPFEFDIIVSHIFGTTERMRAFLRDKFHEDYDDLRKTYLLGNPDLPACDAFRYSRVYASNDNFVLLDGSWVYVFERRSIPPKDATQTFDCKRAGTNVERLICASPDLQNLDATVNRGFVDLQAVESKEISYEDPVRKGQLDWLRNVRNKCETQACLLDAYKSRIHYIKDRISSAYPSYPAQEPDQDGD